MYATIRTRSKVILRSMCDPFWCMQQYSANNGTWRNFFHKKQVSPFKKAILLFKKPVSHLKTSMITLSQNFVSERAKSKLVTKLANQYHILKKPDSHSKKNGLTFKKSGLTFQKSSLTFQKPFSQFKRYRRSTFSKFFSILNGEISNSKNIASLRICPRVNIRRKKNRKNNLILRLKSVQRIL